MATATKILKLIYHLTMPGAVLLGLAALLIRLGLFADAANPAVRFMPYLVFAIGLVLSATFNRSRLFFALLVLVLAESWMSAQIPGLTSAAAHRAAFVMIALLLPLNLLAFSFTQDRGVVSPAGRRRLLVIAAEILMVGLWCSPWLRPAVLALFDKNFIPLRFTAWSHLPQLSLVVFVLAAGALAARIIRRYDVVQSSLLWTLAASFCAMRVGGAGHLATIYFASAGMMLIVGILEVSYNMAFLDELTQLPSRRSFNQAMLKLGDCYTIAMVDVDHFKKFNDTYGHESGDEALRMVASKLARIAGGGRAYRYGGEEFAIVFPGKPADESFSYLDRMRRHIEQSTFVVRGLERRGKGRRKVSGNQKKQTSVTVSIGVCANNGDSMVPEEILRTADQALYRAKQKGRNCTVAARPGKPSRSVKAVNYGMKVVSVE